MNSPYIYSNSNVIWGYRSIRILTLWAGFFGLLQSIAWMGLTVTGIVSFNCIVDLPPTYTFGSLVESVFLFTYFRSDACSKPAWDYSVLKSVDTILDPQSILIWNSVYLGVAVFWMFASVLLLTYIRKDCVKVTSGVMLSWVFFTGCICLMDLALGIIFGIDYGAFRTEAYKYNLYPADGAVTIQATQLTAGMVTAISLMIISLKGFVLWIINFGLMVGLLVLSVRTLQDKDGNDTLFMPRKESDDILTSRPPIKAFEEEISYNNVAFVPDQTSSQVTETIELNQESIARAARISTDVTLKDRRFRNLDAFQQYPPPRYATNNNNNNSNNNKNSSVTVTTTRSGFISTKDEPYNYNHSEPIVGASHPVPDYTPPMARANQKSNNGNMRNHY